MNCHSLTITLAAAFLFLSMAVLFVNGSLNLYFDYHAQQESILEKQQLIAKNATGVVEGFINGKFNMLTSAARFVQIKDPKQELRLVLDKLIGMEPAFRKLAIVDAHEREQVKSSRLPEYMSAPLITQGDADLFSTLRSGNKHIGRVFINDITYEPMVLMSVPITDLFGNFRGALIAETNLKFIWDLVANAEAGQRGQAYVIDKKGYLIAAKDISRVLKREQLIKLEEVQKAISDKMSPTHIQANISTGINGTRVISTHTHLDMLDCMVVVEIPVWEAYKAVLLVFRLTVVSMLLTLVLAVIIGFFLSKRITRPIIGLRNAIGKVGKGNLETKINIQSGNEIGEVAAGFNRMVDNLKKTTVSRDKLLEEIVQRERVEIALKDAKKAAEVASEVKSRFLANMSHEIRTPMNAIVGFAELLKRSRLDETQHSYLASIHESAHNLLVIINDILDLSKIEANKLQFEHINFNFAYLIESVFKMLRSKLMNDNVDLIYHIEHGTPLFFKGDPTRIRQIFINIIGNAIKFTERGEIVVKLGLDRSDRHAASCDGKYRIIRVSIRDTGIGIAGDKKDIIFDSFSQADSSTTRNYSGTGLGLAITKAFVEKMGGRIWVESEFGTGSEFIFLLKLEQAKPMAAIEAEPAGLEFLKGKSVLIVDDNAAAGEMIKEYCLDAKMDICFSGNSAKDALEWMESSDTRPDLIISDFFMSDMDGYEFIRKLKADEKLNSIKTLATASNLFLTQSTQGNRDKFDAYLAKPVVRNELFSAIKNIFGVKRMQIARDSLQLADNTEFKGMCALIAEDNKINMALIKEIFKKFGAVTDQAINGKEAVEKTKETSYDIVFMDVHMPVMNGLEATRVIREEINKHIPIIALTASAMQEDREEAIAAGMNDFISKPIDVQRLKKVIKKYYPQ